MQSTTVRFWLTSGERVHIPIHDVTGTLVRQLVEELMRRTRRIGSQDLFLR
jgi:hypothetical protein